MLAKSAAKYWLFINKNDKCTISYTPVFVIFVVSLNLSSLWKHSGKFGVADEMELYYRDLLVKALNVFDSFGYILHLAFFSMIP